MLPYFISGYHENSLLITIEWPFQVEANIAVHRLCSWLQDQEHKKISRLIPAYHSLLVVVFEPDFLPAVQSLVTVFFKDYQPVQNQIVENPTVIPVCYDPELGNDLQAISQYSKLSAAEIIKMHSHKTYHIYMIGFLPGFPYMGEVHESIAVPRKSEPVSTKSGAVGIAGVQTGIYPSQSPGGWHIVGYTPLCLFDSKTSTPALLTAGQQVKFVPIDIVEYFSIKDHNQLSSQMDR